MSMMINNVPENVLYDEWFEIVPNEIKSKMKMLSKSWPESLNVYNFIKESLEWSSKCKKTKTAVFCNRKWPGSVIATVKGSNYAVAIFSPQQSYSSITSALRGNHIVHWKDGPILFCSLGVELCCQIEDTLTLSGRKILENFEFDSYWISVEAANAIEVCCPEDTYFSKLEDIHATIVNSNWPYASEKSLKIISDMIKFKDTVGLFTKKDSRLVSWVINTYYGVGMLHTIEGYRRKGYGSLVMKKIIKILGQSGRNPTLHTRRDNFTAKSLLCSIGLKHLSTVKSIKVF